MMGIPAQSVDKAKGDTKETLRMKLRNKLYPAFGILSAPDFAWSPVTVNQAIKSVLKAHDLCSSKEDQERCLKVKGILEKFPMISAEEAQSGLRSVTRVLGSEA